MRSGTRTLDWNTPMPGATQRAHYTPRAGDGAHAVRRTAVRAIGPDHIKAQDTNFQVIRRWIVSAGKRVSQLVAVAMHWTRPGQNGYDRMLIDGHIHMMSRAQKRRPLSKWTYEQVMTWRKPNGDGVMTYEQMIAYAVSKGVVIIAELKSRAFQSVALMKSMVDACKRHHHPAWFMALLKQSRHVSTNVCMNKCRAVRRAGGQFAIIFGEQLRGLLLRSKPRNWNSWTKPNQIWGPARAKRWLR